MTPVQVQALLGVPELARLFAEARAALEARGMEEAKTVTLAGLTPQERQAIAGLHGWRDVPGGEKVRLSLAKLDQALRESAAGMGLPEVLVALGGTLGDRRSARAEATAAREELWVRARSQPGLSERPELCRWLDELRAHGAVTRAAKVSGLSEAVLLERAVAAAVRLPAPGILLPVFATELFGDAHALDVGRPEAGLVLRAAAAIAGWTEVPATASERRRLWAEVGVPCDPLSADVLVLGLRPVGDDRLARHLRESAEEGEPRRITLRELMKAPVTVEGGTTVFVCENPSVVAAAADRLGAACAALVCTEGVPSTAALRLLRSLQASGAQVRFHADFDWAGVRIGNLLAAQLPDAAPWRMGAEDYRTSSALEGRGLLELVGPAVTASWDARLPVEMNASGKALLEESVLEDLLMDLTDPCDQRSVVVTTPTR